MKRNVENLTDSERILKNPMSLPMANAEVTAEQNVLKTLRQLEGFPSSYQSKLAFEAHILQRETDDNFAEKLPEGQTLASDGFLGNLVGAALFNEAQCMLVRMQKNNGLKEG